MTDDPLQRGEFVPGQRRLAGGGSDPKRYAAGDAGKGTAMARGDIRPRPSSGVAYAPHFVSKLLESLEKPLIGR
jgi:hypothetical protein